MSTKDHDDMIRDAVDWARSLGYGVVEYNPGTKTGADAIFENEKLQRVILEVVSSRAFKSLFEKARIKEIFIKPGTYWVTPETLGLVIVGDRVENVRKHGMEAGYDASLFEPPFQKIFPVLARHFDKVIPVLMVSLLGAKATTSAMPFPP